MIPPLKYTLGKTTFKGGIFACIKRSQLQLRRGFLF